MENLKRQEVISTPAYKGKPMCPSARPVIMQPDQLPTQARLQINEQAALAPERSESWNEYQQQKAAAIYVAPATRRTRHQQADDLPNDPAIFWQSSRFTRDARSVCETSRAAAWWPPQTSLAVGGKYLLVAADSACGIFDQTGQQLLAAELSDWFAPVLKPLARLYHATVLFDALRNRWVLAACARQGKDSRSAVVLLAISQSSDPLQGWWLWSLDFALDGSTRLTPWINQLGLTSDPHAIYLTANIFDEAGKFRYSTIRALAKREAYAGGILHGWDFWELRNPNVTLAFSVTAAQNLTSTDIQYFLNTTPEGRGLTVWSLRHHGRVPELLHRSIATFEYRLAPNAQLPPLSEAHAWQEIDTGDTRLGNVVYRNGSLWTSHTVSATWGEDQNAAAIQWFQLNPHTASVMQQGVYGAPHRHYFRPQVMVNQQNHLLMLFYELSGKHAPALRLTNRRATDKANTLQASSLLKQSPLPHGKVWGTCTAKTADSSGADFWILGQYASGTQQQWATWVGETTPPPASGALNTRSPSVRSRSRRKAVCA